MTLIDSERVLAELEARLLVKKSWGQKELLVLLAQLRADHRLDEGLLERSLRVLGVQVTDEIRHLGSDPRAAIPVAAGEREHALST